MAEGPLGELQAGGFGRRGGGLKMSKGWVWIEVAPDKFPCLGPSELRKKMEVL